MVAIVKTGGGTAAPSAPSGKRLGPSGPTAHPEGAVAGVEATMSVLLSPANRPEAKLQSSLADTVAYWARLNDGARLSCAPAT